MATSKKNNIYCYIYIFLINLSFICCIVEIPLQAIKVKGIPKYKNLRIIEPGSPLIEKNGTFYYQQGNAEINAESLFFASIKIGSNSQPFNLLLDTGSSVLWVTKIGCTDCSPQITRHYNPRSSTTCEGTDNSFSIRYGTGYVSGDYYNDNVEYLSNKKFNMHFGVASIADFTLTNCDGIIGLTKSYDDERYSFIHMLKRYGNTDSTAFSIKFENDYFKYGVKGTMYIGVHEDFSKSDTVSCPLVYYRDKIFWAAELSSFGLKNNDHKATSSKKINIIFDTGTNFIILPTLYLKDIEKDLSDFNCYSIPNNNEYHIVCPVSRNLPELRFEINGNTLIIPSNYAFYYSNGNKNYVYSMVVFTDSLMNIMGSVFFFLFHTLFDEENNELKFYPLNGKIEGGLSTLVIVIIVICSIGLAIAIGLIVYYYVKRCKRKKEDMPQGDIGINYFENDYHPQM